jgi:hypothetical protein
MLTRRAIVLALIAEGVVFLGMGVVVADVRAHKRVEEERGVNARGFRGPLTIHKAQRERRVAIVGGTAAYGYAVDWPTSLGAALQNRLEQGWREKYRPTEATGVVNLAELGAGASSYIETLGRYSYLEPDVVIVYDGYSASDAKPAGGRESSAVFRRIDYLPILSGVATGRAPWQAPAPDLDPLLKDEAAGDPSCAGTSERYCKAMADTVAWSLSRNMAVVVVSPPYVSIRHQRQQESLATELARQFQSSARFQYLAIGSSAELRDPKISSDGVQLNAGGYEAVGDRIVDAVFDAVHSVPRKQ